MQVCSARSQLFQYTGLVILPLLQELGHMTQPANKIALSSTTTQCRGPVNHKQLITGVLSLCHRKVLQMLSLSISTQWYYMTGTLF